MINSIAIIITVHNRIDLTKRALNAIAEQISMDSIEVEVFLTDDGSTDGTIDVISSDYPWVRLLTGSGDLYWNRGMLNSWKIASDFKRYDFFLWLNNDTIIIKDCIDTLITSALKFQSRSIIVGTTLSERFENKLTYGGRDSDFELVEPGLVESECVTFNGNIVLIPQSVLQIVGYNDGFFRHSLGDYDYGLRARKLGIKSYVAPGFLGYCDDHEYLPDWRNPHILISRRIRHLFHPTGQNPKEFIYFGMRHYFPPKAMLYLISIFLHCLFPKLFSKASN